MHDFLGPLYLSLLCLTALMGFLAILYFETKGQRPYSGETVDQKAFFTDKGNIVLLLLVLLGAVFIGIATLTVIFSSI